MYNSLSYVFHTSFPLMHRSHMFDVVTNPAQTTPTHSALVLQLQAIQYSWWSFQRTSTHSAIPKIFIISCKLQCMYEQSSLKPRGKASPPIHVHVYVRLSLVIKRSQPTLSVCLCLSLSPSPRHSHTISLSPSLSLSLSPSLSLSTHPETNNICTLQYLTLHPGEIPSIVHPTAITTTTKTTRSPTNTDDIHVSILDSRTY